MANLEKILWLPSRSDRHQVRRVLLHKLNIYGEIGFMHQLASQPFVEDMLDGLTLTVILDANSCSYRIAKELLEAFSVFLLWVASLCGSSKGNQCHKECAFAPLLLPKDVRIMDSVVDAKHVLFRFLENAQR